MSDEKPDLNVYVHNQPEERYETAAEPIDTAREKQERETGQDGPPKENAAQDDWHRDDPQVQHAVDDKPDLEDTPMPPRNAPLTDEVPS